MKKIVIFILGIAITLTSFASVGERSYINDKDGYSNIREKPISGSLVVGKILEGEVFVSYPQNSETWIKVETNSGLKGYVHKSRIKTFTNLEIEISKFFKKFSNTPSNYAEHNEVYNEDLFELAQKYPIVFVTIFSRTDSKTQNFLLDQLESPIHDLIDLKLIYGRIKSTASTTNNSKILKAISIAGSKIGMKIE